MKKKQTFINITDGTQYPRSPSVLTEGSWSEIIDPKCKFPYVSCKNHGLLKYRTGLG